MKTCPKCGCPLYSGLSPEELRELCARIEMDIEQARDLPAVKEILHELTALIIAGIHAGDRRQAGEDHATPAA